jgi:hypothetical protein
MLNKMFFIWLGHASIIKEKIDLLVFDEAHAALNCDHVYKQTMY